jgi:tRNA nucleotidyltransferase (CCA-adding enzyme)
VEDPTRVFRAIRFEQRFAFPIGKLTSKLIENAVKMDFFKRLSGRRVFGELRQILEEENPTPAIIRLQDYKLLKVIHPSIKLDANLIALLNSVKKVLHWNDLLFLKEPCMHWTVYFLALIHACSPETVMEICHQMELAPRYQTLFTKNRRQAQQCLLWLEHNLPAANSILYRQLTGLGIELLLYMMAATGYEKVKKAISFYFTRLRQTALSLSGKDLLKMGLMTGPVYRETLQAVLDEKLNGHLKTSADEFAFARRYIKPFL